MKEIKNYTFGEKTQEYSAKKGTNIDVWKSPKYLETKAKVIELLEKNNYLDESDFWILMNETKSGKMGYTGLIISHNGCLKINDNAKAEDKFDPFSVVLEQNGYENSLVYTYANKEQGIYEVGEINSSNYKQNNGRYPYAMALKRLFDRVVLKISKYAFYGVYSDSEADEFAEKFDDVKPKTEEELTPKMISEFMELVTKTDTDLDELKEFYQIKDVRDLNNKQYQEAIAIMKKKVGK